MYSLIKTVIIILLLLFIFHKRSEYMLDSTAYTYAAIPFQFNNDPSSNNFNFIDYRDGAVVIPNANMYANKNLYNIV